MNFDLTDLFPEDMSDEAAFHLVGFFENLSMMISDHYHVAFNRYIDTYMDDHKPSPAPVSLIQKNDDDYPF